MKISCLKALPWDISKRPLNSGIFGLDSGALKV